MATAIGIAVAPCCATGVADHDLSRGRFSLYFAPVMS